MRCFKYIVYLVDDYIMYEKNIVEIKNEYTTFLVNIITPLIYEGIKSVYSYSLETHQQLLEKAQNAKVENPGPLKIFQTCLKELPTLNQYQVSEEVKRIKEYSKCSEWFDDLVKAVVKSNIVLLTFSLSGESNIVKEKYHTQISTDEFIHKCYIESAKAIYNNPELFWHGFPTLEIKRNQRDACEIIRCAIHEAIRKMLPMKLILSEYLQNDYVPEDFNVGSKMPDSQYENVKSMVNKDINGSNDSRSASSDTKNGFQEIVSDKSQEQLTASETVNDLENKLTNIGDKMDDKQIFVSRENTPDMTTVISPNKKHDIPRANDDPEIREMMNQGNVILEPVTKKMMGGKFMPKQQQVPAVFAPNTGVPGVPNAQQEKMNFFAQYLN